MKESEPLKDAFKLKGVKTKFAQNLLMAIPMIEEITKLGLSPFCLIGMNTKPKGKTIYTHWATISDSFDPMLLDLCKQMTEKGFLVNSEQNPEKCDTTEAKSGNSPQGT